MSNIRTQIREATANAKSSTELDALVASGFLKILVLEHGDANWPEIAYEWDSIKNGMRRAVRSYR